MSFDHIANNKRIGTDPFPFDAAATTSDDALDLASLKAFEELQSDDGSDLIIELIDLYLVDAPQQILAIRKAVAITQWEVLRRAAHNLKGSSSTLGVNQVAVICEELEATNSSDSSEAVEALVQVLDYKFAKARQALTTERQRRLS
jgi:HPt (histidine-containing phosphotransfer) domain-containing protein